jgi:hypothetical protein
MVFDYLRIDELASSLQYRQLSQSVHFSVEQFFATFVRAYPTSPAVCSSGDGRIRFIFLGPIFAGVFYARNC